MKERTGGDRNSFLSGDHELGGVIGLALVKLNGFWVDHNQHIGARNHDRRSHHDSGRQRWLRGTGGARKLFQKI